MPSSSSRSRRRRDDAPAGAAPSFGVLGRRSAAGAFEPLAVVRTAVSIGRDAGCEVVLPGALVSRRHARVSTTGESYVVEDLGSRNGTFVNGQRVADRATIGDGDTVTVGDVDLELRCVPAAQAVPPQRRRVEAGAAAPETLPDAAATGDDHRSLRDGLRESREFSGGGLALAVLGSVVGTVFTQALGTGRWGALAGAVVAPLVTTAFAARHSGGSNRVRTASAALLTVAAVVITVGGITLAEAAVGGPVVPGAESAGTFPGAGTTDSGGGSPSPAPLPGRPDAGADPPELSCGAVPVGSSASCDVTITSTGSVDLRVTDVELGGDHAADFAPARDCVGAVLGPGESCTITVTFTPTAPGPRSAELVVRQNIPRPDTGTRVPLTGTAVLDGPPVNGSPPVPPPTPPSTTPPPPGG